MTESETTSFNKTSKYNSAGDQLQRIGELWQQSHSDSLKGDYQSWNIRLDKIWLELAGDLDDNSEEEKKMNGINVEILEVYPLNSARPPSFNKKPKNYAETVSKQYMTLMKKELFLRRLQNKLGKGTAWKDEFEDDF